MFKLIKINDFEIKPIINGLPKYKIKGDFIFDKQYPSILILGKSGSGKTTILANLIPLIADKELTSIHIFSSTATRDPIIESFSEGENKYSVSIHNDLDENMVESIVKQETEEPIFDNKKCVIPKLIFILDDLPGKSRNKVFNYLARVHRHFCSILIFSVHDIKDISPAQINQLSYSLVFPGMPLEKLAHLLEHMGYNEKIRQLIVNFYLNNIKDKNFMILDYKQRVKLNFTNLVEFDAMS